MPEIALLDSAGQPLYVVEQVISEQRNGQYRQEVLTPTKLGFFSGALFGVGVSAMALASCELIGIQASFEVQRNISVALTSLSSVAIGFPTLSQCHGDYHSSLYNTRELPATVTVDEPERVPLHIRRTNGDLSLGSTRTPAKHLKLATGQNIPVSGDLVDALRLRVFTNGEKESDARVTRDILRDELKGVFYPEMVFGEAWPMFRDALVFNKFVSRSGTNKPYKWTEAGLNWLKEDTL